MRAYRPSCFGRQDDVDEEVLLAKEENVCRYARLVQAGLPLFETDRSQRQAEGLSLPVRAGQ